MMQTATLPVPIFKQIISWNSVVIMLVLLTAIQPVNGLSAWRFCKQKQAEDSTTSSLDAGERLNLACLEANQNNWIRALQLYQQVLSIDSANQTALRNQVFVLSQLGAASIAEWQAQLTPTVFSAEELLKLKADSGVLSLRWGKLPLKDENRRFRETELAIDQLEKLLKQIESTQRTKRKWLHRRITFDLIVALRDRWRMQDVLKHYTKLQLEDRLIPDYVLAAVADAFLYLRQPRSARDIYRSALKQNPNQFEWKIRLFYALVENEEIEQALAYIDALDHAEPLQQHTRGDGIRPIKIKPNPHKTETATLAAVAKAYANDYQNAQNKLEKLLELAPANQDIRNELATVYHWRGWHRKAEGLYNAGLAVEPKHLQLRQGHALNLIALNRLQQVEKSIAELERFSFYQQTQGVLKRWQAANGYEFRQQTLGRNSSGAAKGSVSLSTDTLLFSKPLASHYRLFAHYRWSHGDFPEGKTTVQREGAGLEYRDSNWELSAEVHHNQFTANKVGVKLAGNYQFDDHWLFSAGFDTPSIQTPLRAYGNAIYARSYHTEIRYRADENAHLSIGGNYLNFTDGNQRYEVLLSGLQRWLLSPRWRLFLGGELFYSHNKDVNAPYFNPLQDVSIETKLGADILTYRYYDTIFHQHISFNPGMYWQQKQRATITGTLQYEHQWQFSNRLELNYGVTGFSQVFDGERENGFTGYLNFNLRFL